MTSRLAMLACLMAGGADDLLLVRNGWLYHYTGAGERRLVAAGEFSRSPDGKRAVYTAGEVLFLLDATTAKSTPLAGDARQPAWAPAGDWIAFVSAAESERRLRVIRPDASGGRNLRGEPAGRITFFGLAWYPDGQSVAFHDMETLYRVDLEGKTIAATPVEQITGEPYCIASTDRFVPSPADARLLAFTRTVRGTPFFERRYGEPNSALFLYDPAARGPRRLTPENLLATGPAWSRDGRHIYFAGYYDRNLERDPFRIYRIQADGSGLTEVTKGEQPCP